MDSFRLLQLLAFPHHWRISLAKHSPMTLIDVLENLIAVGMYKQSVGLL